MAANRLSGLSNLDPRIALKFYDLINKNNKKLLILLKTLKINF